MPFDPILIYVLIVVAALTILPVYVRHQEKALKNTVIKSLDALAVLEQNGSRMILHTSQGTYDVAFFRVPLQAELTINSIRTFEISSFRKTTRVTTDRLWDKSVMTLVVVYPSLHPIKRFINENEMVFTAVEKPFDNIRIGTLPEIERAIKEEKL